MSAQVIRLATEILSLNLSELAQLRRLLDEEEGPPGAGDREPRNPIPPHLLDHAFRDAIHQLRDSGAPGPG